MIVPASAQVNLNFTFNIEEKIYYPNDELEVEVIVDNQDLTFTAKDAKLRIEIEDRFYDFKLGDMKAGTMFTKKITLPEFPPGTHTIKGSLNYSGIFEERFIEETFNSFEVAFPPIERYPRNVNVIGFNLPEKLEAGKSYDVSIIVKNEGTVGGNMIIEVASLDEFVDEEAFIGPGETKTIDMTINFKNTEVSLIEARVFALINGKRYLLVYSGKRAYIVPERKAKLVFDKVELVDEPDNEINSNDEVKMKVYLSNIGNYPATSVVGNLSSPSNVIEIVKQINNYEAILVGESFGSNQSFEIESKETSDEEIILNLNVDYIDSEPRTAEFNVPVKTSSGSEACTSDNQCKDNEACENSQCVAITCADGYVRNHECIKYECVRDSDCRQYYTCDTKLHICKPPQCESDYQCEDNEVCSEGKCEKAFTVLAVPLGITSGEKSKYLDYAKRELGFFQDLSPLKEYNPERKNLRVHYIEPSICQPASNCEYENVEACSNEITNCASRSGLLSIADKLVAIINRPIGACGFAYIDGFWSVNLMGCSATPVHEMGHQLGLYHIKCSGTEAGACMGPNAADCQDSNFKTDVMGYCSPEDHYGPYAYSHMKNSYFRPFIEGG